MACCGRGKRTGTPPPQNRGEVKPALPTPEPRYVPPPPASPAPEPTTPTAAPKQAQQAKSLPGPAPKSVQPDALPECKYREFKSKQIIGGVEVINYFCRAFMMNVRKEHCTVCQKHDKQ